MAENALFVAKNGVPDVDGAMRVETGESSYVWQPFEHEVADLDAAAAYLDGITYTTALVPAKDMPGDYRLTRPVATRPIIVDEEITGYRLRMAQSVLEPDVEGGYQVDPDEDLGDFNLYRVKCNDGTVPALHAATVEANDGVGGALMMQDSGDYAALPAMGEPVTAGVIYNDSGNLVVARQTHNRTEHPVDTIPALFAVWRTGASEDLDWVDQEQVEVGMRRLYDGVLYECLQAHQTQSDWTPSTVPALWKVVVTETPTADWTPGVTYAVDDVVLYNDQEWRCTQAHTALAHWYPGAPGVYLWELVE